MRYEFVLLIPKRELPWSDLTGRRFPACNELRHTEKLLGTCRLRPRIERLSHSLARDAVIPEQLSQPAVAILHHRRQQV